MTTARDDAALLANIRREKQQAEKAGDEGRLGELEEMTAALLTASGDEAQARRALKRAINHRLRAGDDRAAAKARYGLALLDRSRTGFEDALAELRAVGDHAMVGRTLIRIAGLDIGAQRFAAAGDACESAAAAYADAGLPEDEVGALRLGAYASQLAGDVDAALAFLSQAVERAPTAATAVGLRLDYSALGLAAPTQQDLDEMLGHACNGSLRGLVLLLRAGARAGNAELDQAAADAQEARRIALAGPDPVLYLQACLSLAGIADLRGDRTALLTILFTCQASLADLLGDDARQPVLQVIDSLRHEWGDVGFEQEMATYRAQFKAAQP